MKKLKRRSRLYPAAFLLWLAALAALTLWPPACPIPAAAGTALGALIFASLSAKALRDLKAARLIVENRIFQVRPAVMRSGKAERRQRDREEALEVTVSCFGILIGSRAVKFNQRGVSLRSVFLDRGHIRLTYGTKKREKTVELLHDLSGDEALTAIVGQFRHETGVDPELKTT